MMRGGGHGRSRECVLVLLACLVVCLERVFLVLPWPCSASFLSSRDFARSLLPLSLSPSFPILSSFLSISPPPRWIYSFTPHAWFSTPKTSSGSDTFREINPAVGSFKIHGLPHVVEKKVIKQDDPNIKNMEAVFKSKHPAKINCTGNTNNIHQ